MAQTCVDAKRGPLALEPVGLDEACLATETQPFKKAVDGEVSVVGLGKDAMEARVLEQPAHHGAERLVANPLPCVAGAKVTPTSAVWG